ncbi:hypothetical protein SAMN05421807_106189 [Virgibacillus chiguensis]|uniref:Uncharacterized protein n=2 Tax=Bacillaceae TaxID=186817 RepID=A0A1M5SIL6_9BACI|nr:hypothetical protein SAMN05421807_106189 [Virgibacillus chiguensis]
MCYKELCFIMEGGKIVYMLKHLLYELIGWIFTGVGAYFIYEDPTLILPYISLGIGLAFIIFHLPKSLRRKK